LRGSRLHLVLMYLTEGLAIATAILWALRGGVELLILFAVLVVVTATFHVTYLLSRLYEEVKELVRRLSGG